MTTNNLPRVMAATYAGERVIASAEQDAADGTRHSAIGHRHTRSMYPDDLTDCELLAVIPLSALPSAETLRAMVAFRPTGADISHILDLLSNAVEAAQPPREPDVAERLTEALVNRGAYVSADSPLDALRDALREVGLIGDE